MFIVVSEVFNFVLFNGVEVGIYDLVLVEFGLLVLDDLVIKWFEYWLLVFLV